MNCLFCGGDTAVTNSRPQKRTNSVWRRRQCKDCSTIFTSSEALDLSGSIVVLTDYSNASQPFNRDKLFISIYDSLKHRKTATSDATALTDTILRRVASQTTSATLTTATIRTICIQTLEKFDTAASVQYQAFHPLH